jgi:type IV pilus assembly protein PilV
MSMMNPNLNHAERGFTLIEAMVAVGILAFILTGFAGSLVSGLRATNQAYMRNQATIAATEMADRIRANIVGANLGGYLFGPAAVAPAGPDCQLNNCTAVQMAQDDLDQWVNSLQNRDLINPQAQIQCLGFAPPPAVGVCNLYQVSVMWDGNRTGVNGTNCSGNLNVDLTCYRVTFRP